MQKFRTFGNKVEATHINGVDDVLASVNEAYKNTAAKIIMEYGDKIAPVYESYGKLMDDVEVNDKCNTACGVKCFVPRYHDKINK